MPASDSPYQVSRLHGRRSTAAPLLTQLWYYLWRWFIGVTPQTPQPASVLFKQTSEVRQRCIKPVLSRLCEGLLGWSLEQQSGVNGWNVCSVCVHYRYVIHTWFLNDNGMKLATGKLYRWDNQKNEVRSGWWSLTGLHIVYTLLVRWSFGVNITAVAAHEMCSFQFWARSFLQTHGTHGK